MTKHSSIRQGKSAARCAWCSRWMRNPAILPRNLGFDEQVACPLPSVEGCTFFVNVFELAEVNESGCFREELLEERPQDGSIPLLGLYFNASTAFRMAISSIRRLELNLKSTLEIRV